MWKSYPQERNGNAISWEQRFEVECTGNTVSILQVTFVFRHLGSLTAANWVSFDFDVSYSSC